MTDEPRIERRGSAPGERRGGRQKGTPNKATVARAIELLERIRLDKDAASKPIKVALEKIEDMQIAVMSPREIMLHAARVFADRGDWQAASLAARRAAPFYHPLLGRLMVDEAPERRSRTEFSRAELERIAEGVVLDGEEE